MTDPITYPRIAATRITIDLETWHPERDLELAEAEAKRILGDPISLETIEVRDGDHFQQTFIASVTYRGSSR